MKFKALALAAASLVAIVPTSLLLRSRFTGPGATSDGDGSRCKARRRFLRLRERRLVQAHRDRARPDLRRHRFRAQRSDRKGRSRDRRGQAKDSTANGRLGQQIGDLYASWMDERVEQLGTAPLKPYLARIAAAKTRGDLVDLFARLVSIRRSALRSTRPQGPDALFGLRVAGRPRHAQPRLLPAQGREI